MKNNKGFTLIEMVIVFIIIALLSTIAVPNILSWRANATLSDDARTLKADFEFAKIRAIRDNTPVTISFDTGNNSYSIRIMGPPFPAPLPVPILSRSLVHASINGTTLAGDVTTFNSRGRPNNTGGVTLSNGSRDVTVNLSMIGTIRIN